MKEKFVVEVRLDKWLWVVCFYKICVLVCEMIEGGKVYYNGQCSKSSKIVELNVMFILCQGNDECMVIVKVIIEQCRFVSEVVLLYEEIVESVEKCEKMVLVCKFNVLIMLYLDRCLDKKECCDLL